MLTEKVIKVFISSTIDDLKAERDAVAKAVTELNPSLRNRGLYLFPVDLKGGARPEPSKNECLTEVESSQIVISLLGLRYGSVDAETDKSITELEYDKACERDIPVLAPIEA